MGRFSETWKNFHSIYITTVSCLLCFEIPAPRPEASEAKQPIPRGRLFILPGLWALLVLRALYAVQEEQGNTLRQACKQERVRWSLESGQSQHDGLTLDKNP